MSPSPRPSPILRPTTSLEPAAAAPGAAIIAGDAHIAGTIGGFTFGRWSQGAPWLPALALETVAVDAGAPLSVELDGTATIESWAARVATAADTIGDRSTAIGSGGYPVLFPAPPPGDWVVAVTITYGDGMGSGAYFWRIVSS